MRKMMNKKGFSLVELMIVVVIMGILIAVAIPLYGAITENANNKTCANNIKVIKNTCANYFSSNEQVPMPDIKTLADMMEAKKVPACPLDKSPDAGNNPGSYNIWVDSKTGIAKVECLQYDDHGAKVTTIGSEAKGYTAAATEVALPAVKTANP